MTVFERKFPGWDIEKIKTTIVYPENDQTIAFIPEFHPIIDMINMTRIKQGLSLLKSHEQHHPGYFAMVRSDVEKCIEPLRFGFEAFYKRRANYIPGDTSVNNKM